MPLMAIQAGLCLFAVLGPGLAAGLVVTLGGLALGFAALAWAAWRLERPGAGSAGTILVVALVLRALALPIDPTLSDDVERYVWDGRVVTAGENPYLLAPEAPRLEALRDGRWERLPHRQVPTVYPPLALGWFSIAALSPAPVLAAKVLLAAADLAGCALLLGLAGRLGLGVGRTVWYAWNPLVVLETAGMGHVDALGVAASIAAVAWLVRRRDGAAGLAAVAGVAAKLVPLVALPLWTRRASRPLHFATVTLVALVAVLAPVVLSVGGVPPGLVTYGVSWEFDGPLYEPLWRLVDVVGLDRGLARLLDGAETATGLWHLADPVLPFLYPQLLAKALLALAFAVILARLVTPRRRLGLGPDEAAEAAEARELVADTGRVFAAVILVSATVYPWYLLWVLPWAALARHRGWLLAAALQPLAYLPQFPQGLGGAEIPLFPWVWLAVWGPPAILALVHPRGRRWEPEPTPSRAAPAEATP